MKESSVHVDEPMDYKEQIGVTDLPVLDADDALLAVLGYKSEFRREFGLLETIAFAFSIMGVVGAVATTYGFPLVAGGHAAMVFGWLIPCPFVLCIAASMAELASSMPTSAGLYYFSSRLAPPRWSALASWVTGWVNVTGQIALVCGIDYTCAQLVTTAVSVSTDGQVNLGAGPTYGIFLVILLAHGVLCSAATRVLARLNILYVTINVGTTITAIIALLVFSGKKGTRVSTQDVFTLVENNTGWSNSGWAFLLSFTAPIWTLTGYDSACHISEETSNAARAAPIAIIAGVVFAETLGWLLFIAASFATTSVNDILTSEVALPMGQLFLNILGKEGMLAIWSLIIVVQFVTGAAQGVDASRVVFAFARDHALPGSRWWRKVNSRTATPVNAVWLVMFCSAVVGFLGFSEAALSSLAGASVISLYISYAVPIFLRITFGHESFRPGPFSLGRWSRVVGAIAVAWVTFICVVLCFPSASVVTAADMNYSVLIVGAVFVFAAVSWMVSARRWFTGPVKTIEDME